MKTRRFTLRRISGLILMAFIASSAIACGDSATEQTDQTDSETDDRDNTDDSDNNNDSNGNDSDGDDDENNSDDDNADNGDSDSDDSAKQIRSQKQRVQNPNVSSGDLEKLSGDNATFGFELYEKLVEVKPDKNLFYSPYSISVALAMTYGGAEDQTETEMAKTLNFNLKEDILHRAFNKTDQLLNSLGSSGSQKGTPFELSISNSVWAQKGFEFVQQYLDLLATQYGAGLRAVDFQEKPEKARRLINELVAKQTKDKIEKLMPEGSIKPSTRMVLTNAIYFNASWKNKFDEEDTSKGEFQLKDGSTKQVDMMSQTSDFTFVDTKNAKLAALPYVGDNASMIVALPDKDTSLEQFEQNLSADTFERLEMEGSNKRVELQMPKFDYKSEFNLTETLSDMGMPTAFSGQADFSGMSPESLLIQSIIHKATVTVDEKGTEAAAATGVVVGETAVPQTVEMRLNRPFVFAIKDHETNSILFVGRVLDPSA